MLFFETKVSFKASLKKVDFLIECSEVISAAKDGSRDWRF
jgi:hypothetical protein